MRIPHRLLLLVKPWRPLLTTVADYDRHKLRYDLFAGLTVAIVAVPQSIAYAFIAGVPPEYGLYTVIIQCFIGSLFNSQPLLSVGPINTQSLLVASTVTRLVAAGDSAAYLQLVFALTLIKGIVQLVLATARLGRMVSYVSYSVIVGFTAGAGVLIAVGQIPTFLGLSVIGRPDYWPGLIGAWQRLAPHLSEINPGVVSVGLLSLVLVVGCRFISRLVPGPLIAVGAGAAVVALAGGNGGGQFVPDIEPAFVLTLPRFTAAQFENLLPGALALSILGLMEAYSIGKSIAAKTGTRIDANQELFSQGMTNFISSFFGCFPGSGSFSRSALNHYAGARTRFAGVFNAVLVLVIFVLFAPLAAHIPMASIAAILFVIAYELVDWRYLIRTTRSNRADAAVCIGTFLATLFVPLAYAVFVGVFLNIALYLRRASQLHITEMVQNPAGLFEEHPMSIRSAKQVRFIQIEGDLFFALADQLQNQLAELGTSGPRVVIFRLKRTHYIDTTVLVVLEQFTRQIQLNGGHIILCGVRPFLMRVLRSFDLIRIIGPANVFESTHGVFASARQALHRACELLGGPADIHGLENSGTNEEWAYEI